jgi:hypothetical protein
MEHASSWIMENGVELRWPLGVAMANVRRSLANGGGKANGHEASWIMELPLPEVRRD